MVKWQNVKSSHITKIGYDNNDETLHIEFHGGDVWKYGPYTEDFYHDMLDSSSVGKFFHQNVKNDSSQTITERIV